MPVGRNLTLTDGSILGLFFMQRYRFLTISQFARVADLKKSTASSQLLMLERYGLLSHFGNTGLVGHGKTPKVYFLTRKGYEILLRESDIPPELIGHHKEIHVQSRWSPQMYHRLQTVDVMVSAECAVRSRPHLSMVATFLEYRRAKRGTKVAREATDYVASEETGENRIIPDAAFILGNIETKKRRLYFIEMDMGTERIVSLILRDSRITVHHKFLQYDRYLQSKRYAQTYAQHGEFVSFVLLFVTTSEERIENIRRELEDLPAELANYYRLATFDAAMGDLLGQIWKSRLNSDKTVYSLVR
ncbi:MAG TPA: replication-relaxation family protein [Candidatus Acidoferrum sp.]|nr:replication-relaxation family protein [Candidatus Acidoferrum sp.]